MQQRHVNQSKVIEPQRKDLRNHPRILAPKELVVVWRSADQRGASRLGTVGLGGMFLKTPKPLAAGSAVELVIQVSPGTPGTDVRARAVVYNVKPGEGMGVKFVQMRGDDRLRLNQFLNTQMKTQKIEVEGSTREALTPPADDALSSEKNESASKTTAEADISEEELKRYLTLARTGTHYHLLGITSDSSKEQVKQGFYQLARKFHPDRHMNRSDWKEGLQQVMGAATEAYQTLSDDDERFGYDKRLASARPTESQETVEESVKIAAACLRDQNVPGYIFWMQKCVDNAPSVAKYRVSLAMGLMLNERQCWEAVHQFEKAIELDPFNTAAYLEFGALYEQMLLPRRACALYSKILELDSTHAVAKERLATLQPHEKKPPSKVGRLFSTK
jgi:tetratricopeptide (TPR) repeat protein